MNQSPRPETVLKRTIARMLREASTSEPGVVESYDRLTCTADVQPLLMRVTRSETGDRVVKRAPVVTHCPVLFVGGGGSRLTFPIKRGDVCLLITTTRSLDRWNSIGGEVDPKDNRSHHITDSIALCGLIDSAHAKPAHATATVLEGDDIRLGDDTGTAAALHSDLAGLVSIIDGWVPVATDGGAALKTAYTTYKAAHPGWPFGATKVRIK